MIEGWAESASPQEEVWAAAAANDEGPDVVADMRAMRKEDNRLADAAAERGTARGVHFGGR